MYGKGVLKFRVSDGVRMGLESDVIGKLEIPIFLCLFCFACALLAGHQDCNFRLDGSI